jgi:DNA-nicking Smr family endonuclease
LNTGIVELDIHGMTRYQAKVYLDSELKKAKKDIYRIRVIHGYQGGTQLRDLVRKDYSRHPKVIRVEIGLNQGITDLILREL